MRKHYICLFLLFGLAALFPVFSSSYFTIAIMVLLFIGWATAWDILGGWAGQLSLGHSAFVGIGAYSVALGAEYYGIAPWWSLLIAMAISGLLALLWGRLTFRLIGPYFTLSTIAIAEILRLIAINEKWLTGGATGVFISILPEPFGIDFFDKTTQFYLAWLFALSCMLVVFYISRHKFGYQLRAIREDEQSAMAAGVNPTQIKLRAFVLSAMLTSVGGWVYGLLLSFLEPHIMFHLLLSIQIALTAIIGGRGTLWGPAFGAILLVLAGETFRTAFSHANMLIYGLLILLVVLFFPRGVVGEFVSKLIRRRYADRAQS